MNRPMAEEAQGVSPESPITLPDEHSAVSLTESEEPKAMDVDVVAVLDSSSMGKAPW